MPYPHLPRNDPNRYVHILLSVLWQRTADSSSNGRHTFLPFRATYREATGSNQVLVVRGIAFCSYYRIGESTIWFTYSHTCV